MNIEITKFAFSAGVIAPELRMRGDLDKFELGVAEAHNFFIDYTGGASTRPGFEFLDYVQCGGETARVIPFEFNENIANTYVILFSADRIRFLQDGAYVLEDPIAYTASGSTVTAVAHGYLDGDLIKIAGESYTVTRIDDDSFTVAPTCGLSFTPASSGFMARVYTLESPYAPADLRQLTYSQDRATVILNHPDYPEYELTRTDHTTWAISLTEFGSKIAAPASLTLTGSAAGAAAVLYAVTAVDGDGNESPPIIQFVGSIVDFTSTAGAVFLSWAAVTRAVKYNVYRTLVLQNIAHGDVTVGNDFGFLGSSRTTTFTDNNLQPDFTTTFPTYENPFMGGALIEYRATGGAAYNRNTSVADLIVPLPNTGTGVRTRLIVDKNGVALGVRILETGQNYNPTPGPVLTGPGTGATIGLTFTPFTGNFPACSALVQQRRVRGGTINSPATLFGSRIGQPTSYSSSGFQRPDDPYFLTLDVSTLTPIRHILAAPKGMFVFLNSGVYYVYGADDNRLSAETAKADPQTENGCSIVPPIKIDRDFIFVDADYDGVYAISPSNLPTYYTTALISLWSAHFMKASNPIVEWTWAKAPHRLVWAVRANGTFLSMTYVPDQKVYAWTEHSTNGLVESVCTVKENNISRVYALINRYINGEWKRTVERLSRRTLENTEDQWAVDAGLSNTLTYPAASLTLTGRSGTIIATASASIFSAKTNPEVFRFMGARGFVTDYISGTQVEITLDSPINFAPETQLPPYQIAQGAWSLTEQFSSFSGLWHLEGQDIEVLADGEWSEVVTVTDGAISLSGPASYVVAGLPYPARLKTLPLSLAQESVESKNKRTLAIYARVFQTSALEAGDEEQTYPLNETDLETLIDATGFKDGLVEVPLATAYSEDAQVTFLKTGPAHASVLGLIQKMEMEDG